MEINDIITFIFAWLSVIFAWLSFRYSKLAYTRNQFSWKVSMNYALADFWKNWIIDIITFSFTNYWHRNWIIRNVYLELNNKKTIWFNLLSPDFFVKSLWLPNFPYELSEMWEISFSMFKDDFEKMIKESTENWKAWKLKYLCFSDNAWNTYKYKIKKSKWKFLFS
jgi:hypothetical protein